MKLPFLTLCWLCFASITHAQEIQPAQDFTLNLSPTFALKGGQESITPFLAYKNIEYNSVNEKTFSPGARLVWGKWSVVAIASSTKFFGNETLPGVKARGGGAINYELPYTGLFLQGIGRDRNTVALGLSIHFR